LRAGKGIELCAKIAVFLVKAHQAQIISNRTMMTPLRELQTLVRSRTTEIRDTIGFNMAAMKSIARLANERKQETKIHEPTDIWGTSLGL
jgi:U3 small nucleolar RNA-associated protein 12